MQAWSSGLKALGWFVVVLMVLAMAYTAWIVMRNWPAITV